MVSESDDARSELRRRVRDVVRAIDGTLALHSRRPRVESFSLVPHIPLKTTSPSQRRRRELQAQRVDAERLLDTLKRERERRERRSESKSPLPVASEITMTILPPRSTNLDSQHEQEQEQQHRHVSGGSSVTRSPGILDATRKQQGQEREGSINRQKFPHEEMCMSLLEEAMRKRLLERREEEKTRLEKLRTVRRSAMMTRQKALAEVQAQIEQIESERLAKLTQYENEAKRSVAEIQELCVLTDEEIRAMEAHQKALTALRAYTGIKAESTSPVRPPPSLPTPTVAFVNASSNNSSSAVTNENASVKATLSPPVEECGSPSTAYRAILSASPVKHVGTQLTSPSKSQYAAITSSKYDIPDHLSFTAKGRSENGRISLSVPSPGPSSFAGSAGGAKEMPHSGSFIASSVSPPQARPLLSPSISSAKGLKGDKLATTATRTTNSFLPTRALDILQKQGFLADVLPNEGRVIPTLVRISKDRRELLLHVEKVRRNLSNSSSTSSRRSLSASSSVALILPQHKQHYRKVERQGEQHTKGLSDGLTGRVREVYHFPLEGGLFLYPCGTFGGDSSGNVNGIWCGAHARQLLVQLSCTLFAHEEASPYCVFFIIQNPPNEANRSLDAPPQPALLQPYFPNGVTLLVLRFRCRWDWAAFLMAVSSTAVGLERSPTLSYGRALWILAARLYQRQRRNLNLSMPTKHYRVPPLSVLSFSPRSVIKQRSSTIVSLEHRERSKSVRTPSGRFALPPFCEEDDNNSNNNDSNNDDRFTSCAVVVGGGGGNDNKNNGRPPRVNRKVRFGVQSVDDSVRQFAIHSDH